MGSVNKVFLIGRLGKDPEIRYSQSGTAVGNLSLATSERIKRDGEWTEQTEWHRLVLFGKTAENAAKYLVKGREVYVEGRLQTRKWQDKDGNDRYSTEVVVNQIVYLGSGGGGGGGDRGGSSDNGGSDSSESHNQQSQGQSQEQSRNQSQRQNGSDHTGGRQQPQPPAQQQDSNNSYDTPPGYEDDVPF